MENNKDYYKILGVAKDASQDEIKKAFRKLAMQYHPDKFASKSESEKKVAEDKMKDINEAYETLSDETKRKEYDNPNPFGEGGNPFEGFGGFGGFEDIFNMFGGGGRRRSNQPKKGSNIRINLEVSIDDILQRTTKKVKYTRKESNGKTCPHCGGTGQLFQTRGTAQIITTCPYCGGNGVGVKESQHECEFVINGIDDTNDLNFNPSTNEVAFVQIVKGEGNVLETSGDLVVIIRFRLPKQFTLESSTDISFVMEVPVLTALLGGEITVDTIDGKKIKARIPQGVSDGTRIRFGGKGLMSHGKIGNMFGIVKLKMPKTLTNKEKEILSQLENSTNFK